MRELQAVGRVSTKTSIDTIELFFPKPPAGLRSRLEEAVGRRIKIEDCLDATDFKRGVRAIINRPNRRTLAMAGELLQANKSASLSRVDIAADFEVLNEESARTLARLLDRHLVLKWRSPTATKVPFDTTVYWANARRKRRNRNLVIYRKGVRTIRLELRFLGTPSARRVGLTNPVTLLGLNPRNTLEHNIALHFFTDRFVQKAIRKAVGADRKRHMKKRRVKSRTSSAELIVDQYRSRIARRVEAILRRIDMQERRSENRATSRQRVALGRIFDVPERLSWPNGPEQSSFPMGATVITTHTHLIS